MRDWSLYTSWISYVLAYSIAMRESEYSETKYYESPKLWQAQFYKNYLGSWVFRYIIPKSKKNNDITNPEILDAECCCPLLCVYHTMKDYMIKRLLINNQLSENNKKYLFLFEANKKLKFKNPKCYSYTYKKPISKLKLIPYKSDNAARTWKSAVSLHLKKKKHNHNLHGFRAANATELLAMGVAPSTVKAMTRHSNNSRAFQRYVKLTPEITANIIKNKKAKIVEFKNKQKMLKNKSTTIKHKISKKYKKPNNYTNNRYKCKNYKLRI